MKISKRSIIIVLLLITVGFLSISYKFMSENSFKNTKSNIPHSKSGYFLGTFINIKLYGDSSDKIFENVFEILKEIESKMSVNIDNSEVAIINKNAGKSKVMVSPDTFYVIEKGKYYSNLSKGHFDVSIGSLVKLWGIGSDSAKVPEAAEIEKCKSMINYMDISLDNVNRTVMLKNQGMIIDLGGIAKGYAADKITQYLVSEGIQNAIINLGGNVYVLGANPDGKDWSVGIQNPFEPRGQYLGIVHIKNKSVVTSGIYERYFEKDGKRYHHILNPFSGYPVENSLVSTTIISDRSIDGDALSTTVFTLGLTEGMKLIESLDNIDAIFITNENKVYMTSGIKDIFTLTNTQFKPMN